MLRSLGPRGPQCVTASCWGRSSLETESRWPGTPRGAFLEVVCALD